MPSGGYRFSCSVGPPYARPTGLSHSRFSVSFAKWCRDWCLFRGRRRLTLVRSEMLANPRKVTFGLGPSATSQGMRTKSALRPGANVFALVQEKNPFMGSRPNRVALPGFQSESGRLEGWGLRRGLRANPNAARCCSESIENGPPGPQAAASPSARRSGRPRRCRRQKREPDRPREVGRVDRSLSAISATLRRRRRRAASASDRRATAP